MVAFFNRRDSFHSWAKDRFAEIEPPLITCEPVLTEASFLLRNDPRAADGLLELLHRGAVTIGFSLAQEVEAVRKLQHRYAKVPMSLADACLVRQAELLSGSTVLTLDSDFSIYRMHGRRAVPSIQPRRG